MSNPTIASKEYTGLEIAVIGVAGRFPGAKNPREFWNNLVQGVESISFFSEEELFQSGVDPEEARNPHYVKAKGVLADIEYFDAPFFGHTPREAEILSPQTRLSLECAWEALEDAGYDPDSYEGAVGVFIGASHSVYWEALSVLSGKRENFGEFESTMLNNKDFLSTRISYKLNLRGPSFNIFTGCSTSGVSLHQACQSLLSGESDMALAGGVSLWLPKKSGCLYQEGSIFSRDGHCRAFADDANGTVFGDGIGIVVLKSLEDAAADGDHIYAVIKGSGINNDGNRKVGYPAPSTEGEAAAIRAALHMADVEPESISYIETHGTGTRVGDPIEVEALKLAFNTDKKGFCIIGSVKNNIGHLNTASGVSGFIKVVLALKHRLIPPSIHFVKPNPQIDFENSPFRVNTHLTPWDQWKGDAYPLRAGFSSFGVGGTNIHMVLEEAPGSSQQETKTREYQLILLSARTESALQKATENFLDYLKKNSGINLADAAYTLQVGRRAFKHRKMTVCSTVEEAVTLLSSPGSQVSTYSSPEENISLIFMFPGQGSQYVNMGLDLYKTEPIFREEMDRCFEILKSLMSYDLKEILYPHSDCRGGSLCPPKDCIGSLGQGDHRGSPLQSDRINQTEIAQLLLFVVEYALAKLMMKWGTAPDAMIGHSIGEYVAACLAGVFSLEDALKLVTLRGKLMQQMSPGAMLGVGLSEKALIPLLNDGLALAAVNGPSACVVSGSHEAVETFKEQLEEKGIETTLLHTSHAFHSSMMDPILEKFQQEAANIPGNAPGIPYISNISGDWITVDDLSHPGYWSDHLRRTVRFADGINRLLNEINPVFVEVGPGNALGTLVRKIRGDKNEGGGVQPIVSLVRHPQENVPDLRFLLDKLGRLWLFGTPIHWKSFYHGESRHRIPLPTYPFEGQYSWIKGNPFKMVPRTAPGASDLEKKPDLSDWFYIPLWKQSAGDALESGGIPGKPCWMVLAQENGLASRLLEQLQIAKQEVIAVKAGTGFIEENDRLYTINPGQKADYEDLFKELDAAGRLPDKILHLWGIDSRKEEALDRGFYSLVYLARALGKIDLHQHIRIIVVTDSLWDITGEEVLSPEKAMVLGPVITINQECAGISCRSIDIRLPGPGNAEEKEEKLVRQLLDESGRESTDLVVVYRNNHRWERTFEPVKLEKPNEIPMLRKNGVYLITGGLGSLGFLLAKELFRHVGAKLVLTGRSQLPPEIQWNQWLSAHDEDDPISEKIKKVQELREMGTELMVFQADTADREQMERVIRVSEEQWGSINGVIHAAGMVGERAFRTLDQLQKTDCQQQFQAKVHGLLTLHNIFRHKALDFCLLMSSIASQLGGLGLTAYAAANIFMDTFAAQQKQDSLFPWISVNWDIWQSGQEIKGNKKKLFNAVLGQLSMTPQQGIDAFYRILGRHGNSQVLVSTGDLPARIHRWAKVKPIQHKKKKQDSLTTYAAPRNQVESIIANVIREYLGIEQVGIYDSFFDLGATSLDLARISTKLNAALGKDVPLVHLLTYPSIASFAAYYIEEVLGNKGEEKNEERFTPAEVIPYAPSPEKQDPVTLQPGVDIAVIGMAGRFPGASHIEEFWQNLKNGMDSITFFSDQELMESGVSRELLENPDYIKAKAVIAGVEYFDALFFDYSPREAGMMDPQARIFHECVWEVLEHAGYEPHSYPEPIGLFVGANPHYYWDALYTYRQFDKPSDQFGAFQFYDKDFMSTRISHKLNLKGPAFTMYTACSSSLVAIHLACQSLLSGDSYLAVAGGVSVWLPEKLGYLYEEGMILSADGHLRTFDEKATGSVFGDGVGVVVLKKLEHALLDGDTLHALIKGSAINNDGSRKLAYTAPSVEGQAEVIAAAQKVAAVEPGSITYLEAHGTATSLGDVVEIEALNRVFTNIDKKQFCGIGTVKTNVGHLNSAAGVTGFIKTVMALKYKQIPPSLYFETSNPRIDFDNTPFYVVTKAEEWKNNGYPLRAGVSSFGIGGTNAHVILEEPPPSGISSPGREWKLLMLSAKSKASLDKSVDNMAQFLTENPGINLDDVVYTLQVGRKPFQHRKMVVCSTAAEAVEALSNPGRGKLFSGRVKNQKPAVIFMFPGQGSQYINMGLGLYQHEKVFREEMHRCLDIFKSLTGNDITEILYPTHPAPSGHPSQEGSRGGSLCPPKDCIGPLDQGDHRGSPLQSDRINRTEITQAVIFMFEYALAKLVMSWGIRPEAMIGYSFGEYAAACIAGVFSLEDALRLVVLRGRLMQKIPGGAMLSVPIPREELKILLEDQPSLAIAIDNGPSCVVSGTSETITALEKQMKEKKYICIRVSVSHAVHSAGMEPVLAEFEREVREIKPNEPQIPYISNVTGKTVNPGEVTDPAYWVKHLKETVLFADGISQLLEIPYPIFLEVGPGRDLTVLLRSHKDYRSSWRILNLVRHEKEKVQDLYFLMNRVGHLWLYGVDVDWQRFYGEEKRHRIPLPTYSFESRHFPIDPLPLHRAAREPPINPRQKKVDINDWFYKPLWKRSGIPKRAETFAQSGGILLLADQHTLGSKIKAQLARQGFRVFTVRMGNRFTRTDGDEYTVNPVETGDYEKLFDELQNSGHLSALSTVLHLWNVAPAVPTAGDKGTPSIEELGVKRELDRGFYSLIALSQVLGKQDINYNIQLKVVTNNVHDVIGGEALCPGKITLWGPVNVIEREFPGVRCCMIDLILPEPGSQQEQELANQLVRELKIKIKPAEWMIAYRNGHRWVEGVEPLEVEKTITAAREFTGLRERGVYLVTGGVGGMGLILARHLAESVKAKLILTGRSAFPDREQWEEWLSTHPREDKTSQRILEIRRLEELGAEVLVFAADTADYQAMQQVLQLGEQHFGKLNGVIHAAGMADGAMIPLRTREMSERILAPKVAGTLVLHQLLKDSDLDFWVFCSSIATTLPFPGQTAYVAANAFLDAFALSRRLNNGIAPISINWDRWQGIGIAVIAEREHKILIGDDINNGITPTQGIEVFDRILADPHPRVIVSTYDLEYRINQLSEFNISSFTDALTQNSQTKGFQERPELSVVYVEPTNDIEQKLAGIWQEYLGLHQVGIHDNFFELGATSLDIIQVNNRLNTLLGTKIPLVKLLTYTTVSSFSNYYLEEVVGEKVRAKSTNRSDVIQRGKQKLGKKFRKRHGMNPDI